LRFNFKGKKMITMVDKAQILIKYYREQKSERAISRELKINRKTVRKYISEHESEIKSNDIENHLEQGLSFKPRYKSHNRSKTVLTHDIEEEINSCLKKNKEKINNGMRKQIMKKIDIFNYLQEKSYLISYPTVCNYIRNTEKQGKESFIKQLYHPGEICEFDWGEVKIYIDGKLQTLNMAVFTSAYSNYRFAKLFYRQDSLAFSQSHIDFFSYTGGVYKTMVYDNMRVAVARFVGHREKTPTRALLELSSYYKFGFRFCNVRSGNEKGHVEKSVDYIRRKSFSIKDEFASVEQANEYLLQSCEKLNNTGQILKSNKTANKMFLDEKPNLFIVKYPYKCFEDDHAKVDKYSTVYAKMIEKKCTLFVNQMVISEFINRCMRIDFERNFNSMGDKNYKADYRPSSEYKATLRIVLNQLKKILKNVQLINDNFEAFDIFEAYAEHENDFNDLIIAHTVKEKGLKLFSDDGDFKNSLGIDTDWYLVS